VNIKTLRRFYIDAYSRADDRIASAAAERFESCRWRQRVGRKHRREHSRRVDLVQMVRRSAASERLWRVVKPQNRHSCLSWPNETERRL